MHVSLNDVGHRFGHQGWLFRYLNGRFTAGETIALVGPSGSGKTTLLGILAGWITPAEGMLSRPAGRIQWVFQNPHGVAQRTALDHVRLPLLAQGLRDRQATARAMLILERFGIGEVASRSFSTLSGGEAQRLMLARAMAAQPDLLLVDDPTAQLDQATAREVAASLHALADRNVLVVIATHDPHVRDSCQRVLDLAAESASR